MAKFIPDSTYLGIAGANVNQLKLYDVSEKNFVKKPHGTIDTNFENIYSFDIYKDTKDKDKDNIACRFLIAYKNKLKSFQANVHIDKSKM